jgi:hypothetical protein
VATLFVRSALGVAFGDRPLLILFIFPVILSAYVGGLGPGILSTILAAAIVDYFLIPPTGSLLIAQPYDIAQWLMFVLNGAIISLLTEALHRFRASAEKRTVDFIKANSALEELISAQQQAEAALQEKNRELVGDAPKLTAGAIDARGVKVAVTAADSALFGDRTRLLEIWQNLLENAVKYMGAQESPRIEIGLDGSGRETGFMSGTMEWGLISGTSRRYSGSS